MKGQVWRGLSLSAGKLGDAGAGGGVGGQEGFQKKEALGREPRRDTGPRVCVGWPVLALRRLGAGKIGARSGKLDGVGWKEVKPGELVFQGAELTGVLGGKVKCDFRGRGKNPAREGLEARMPRSLWMGTSESTAVKKHQRKG